MFDIHPGLFTLAFSIIAAIIAAAVSWGVYKTKIHSILEKIKEIECKSDTFKKWVYDSIDASEDELDRVEKELTKKITDDIKELNSKRDIAFKDLESRVRIIDNRCASREVYTKSVPQLTTELNNLKVEVSTLPSKISSELTKSFSEEYQKIISVIVNKTDRDR